MLKQLQSEISDFRRRVAENFAILRCYAVFRDCLRVPHLRVKQSPENVWTSKIGPLGCPETSVISCHHTPCNTPEERRPQLHSSMFQKLCYFWKLVVKFSLNLIESQDMKMYGRTEVLGISTHSQHQYYIVVTSQPHTPVVLPSGQSISYPLNGRLHWSHERVW
jgi:hypothetical protein